MNNATQKQDILQQTFEKNLFFFKKYHKKIGVLIEQHIQLSKKNELGIDNHGEFNIWCSTQWLYGPSTSAYNKQQIHCAIQKPQVLQLQISPSQNKKKWHDYHFFHQFFLEKIRLSTALPENTQAQIKNKPTSKAFSPALVMFGNGLGLHLKSLLESIQTYHLFIFEPDIDFFYFSLFLTDYQALEKKNTPQLTISYCIGQQWPALFTQIQKSMQPLSIFKASQIQLIQHYQSKANTQAFQALAQNYGQFFDTLGFMEDECVGVSHFLRRLERPAYFLQPKDKHKITMPAVIVGSGPSFDQDVAQLKKIQHQVIIISCSSSISALYHHDITPDFHAECERLHHMVDCLQQFPDQQYLKKIHLLSLSPCHPDLDDCFASQTIAHKYADIASEFWQHHMTTQPIATLKCANPTAGNCALSFAVELGFQKIVLIGLDFGQKNDQQHHSTHSLYNTMASMALERVTSSHEVPGNFSKKVKTTLLLDKARQSAEALLRLNPIDCFNASDGALIQGTTPCPLIAFSQQILPSVMSKEINKKDILADINQRRIIITPPACQQTAKPYQRLNKQWLQILFDTQLFAQSIELVHVPNTIDQWASYFLATEKKLQRHYTNNQFSAQLIYGSLSSLQSALYTTAFHHRDSPNFLALSQKLVNILNQSLRTICSRCIQTHGTTNSELLHTLQDELKRLS